MNLLFVNYVHPLVPHVSSMRMRLFAEALTQLDHRVVLLTHPVTASGPLPGPDEVERLLTAHNWRSPFHISCLPQADWRDIGARAEQGPRLRRRCLIAANYLTRGGIHDDWVRGSKPYWPLLIRSFRPGLVWGGFGNSSTLVLAQGFARTAGIPWLMDHKDSWELFIPKGLRRIVAHRFRDAAGFTANAEFHAAIAARYHQQKHVAIYSGVVPEMISPGRRSHRSTFRIVLVGSVYDMRRLQLFLEGLSNWLQSKTAEEKTLVEFRYAGTQSAMVEAALAMAPLDCKVRIDGQLPIRKLAELCQTAAVNAYIWSPFTFHHKLLELLACRNPVISFPGEHEESITLAKEVGGCLKPCISKRELSSAFSDVWRCGSIDQAPNLEAAELSWVSMARKLDAFLMERYKAARATLRHPRCY